MAAGLCLTTTCVFFMNNAAGMLPGGLARAGAGPLGLHAYNKSPQGKAHKALAERRELEGNGDVVFLPREVLQSFGQSEAPAGGEASSSAAGMEKALGVTDTDVVKSTKEVMIDREKYERAARENPTFRAAAEAYVRYGSEGRTFSETAAEIRDNISDPINAETPFARSARVVRDRKIQALKDAGADDRTAEAGGYIWAKSVLRRAYNLGENEFGVLRDDALTPEQLDNLNVRGEKNAEADWDGAVYEQAVRAGLNLDERVPVVTLESETDKKLTPQRLLAKLTDQLDKSLGITADGEADVHVRSRGRRRLPRHIVYSSLKRLSPKKLTARSQVVNSIGDLIPHAWLVESSATNKVGKDNVAAYHRFYVPVRIGNTLHVIRVVAEESKTSKGLKPMDVDLYDVIIENSGSVMPRLTSPKRSIHSDSSVSEGSISEEITSQKSAMEITIRDMLRGVKGMDGEYYAQRSLPDAEAERERSAVVEAAKANGTYLKAPNGNKTNLTPAQWELVRSKSFHVIDDGSSVIQRTPGYPSTSYAVFDPKQMKAIDNRGTFSPDDANIYNQAVRPGIDLNERVRVINLSAAIPEVKGWNVTKLARYVKSLIGNEPSISLDALGIVGLPSKKKKYSHIAASDHKVPGELIPTRNAAVFSIEELLKNSMLVEVEDNTKKGKKPDVESYLKFYVPISANGKLYTVEIITESQEKIDPANVVLADATAYDVKLTRKKNPSPTLHRNGVSDTRGSFDVTVRQMLENVKGGRLVTEIEALNGAHLSQKRRGQIQIGPNGEGAGRRDLLQKLKGQLGRESSLSRDGLALLNLPNSGQKLHHIAYSGAPFHSQDSTARNAAVFSLSELMKNAVLVESGPNRKKNKKPGVRIYHRFYVPVATRVGIATVRIVAEEKNNSDRLVPIDVSVYDVIINKRIPCTQPTDASASTAEDSFSRITLREMLRGVKGMDGKIYARPMNAGVNLNQEVTGVVIQSRLTADEAHALKRNAHKKDFARRLAGDYINRDTGWTLHLSLTNVSHAISSALIRNDVAVSFEKSMQILEGLPELLANAKLVESHKDRKGRQNIRNIHRFYASARLTDDSQTTYTVKITVKELEGKLQAQIDKIYESHDARVIKKVSDVSPAPQGLNKDSVKQNTPDTYDVILRDVLDNVKDNDGNLYFQSAWHGSPYRFESFDFGAVGSGEGGQAHGWGLYFARDKKIAEGYRAKLESEGNGALFEVDVPENDVLLDEDLQLPEQPKKVREAISKYYRSRPDDYIAVDSDSLPEQNGKLFLKEVIRQLAREGEPEPKKAASLLLNSLGIKGITYDGSRDGRCFVVFDDKAVSVIERYNQEVTGQPLVREGLTRKPDSAQAKVVHLPEKAVPQFPKIQDFNKWVKALLMNDGNPPVKILSTGQEATFTGRNIRSSLKRARSEAHREAYAALRQMISLAEYDRFEPADAKHLHLRGQDIYYSALSMGDRLYSVRLKLDVPPAGDKGDGRAVYKDHRLTEITIAPALYSTEFGGNQSRTQEAGAISTVSLGVLRGNVKSSNLEGGHLQQKRRGQIQIGPNGEGAASLVNMAYLRTIKLDNFRNLLAGPDAMIEPVLRQMDLIRKLQSINGLTVIDGKDDMQMQSYTFSGLDQVLLSFGQQLSGASDIPLTRLFGQSPAGLNSTGDSDIKTYYDGILRTQESQLRWPLQLLLEIESRNLFGVPLPRDANFTFAPLWQISDTEKSAIDTNAVTAAYGAGLIDEPTALRELQSRGKITGRWDAVTADVIAAAEAGPPAMEAGDTPG